MPAHWLARTRVPPLAANRSKNVGRTKGSSAQMLLLLILLALCVGTPAQARDCVRMHCGYLHPSEGRTWKELSELPRCKFNYDGSITEVGECNACSWSKTYGEHCIPVGCVMIDHRPFGGCIATPALAHQLQWSAHCGFAGRSP